MYWQDFAVFLSTVHENICMSRIATNNLNGVSRWRRLRRERERFVGVLLASVTTREDPDQLQSELRPEAIANVKRIDFGVLVGIIVRSRTRIADLQASATVLPSLLLEVLPHHSSQWGIIPDDDIGVPMIN